MRPLLFLVVIASLYSSQLEGASCPEVPKPVKPKVRVKVSTPKPTVAPTSAPQSQGQLQGQGQNQSQNQTVNISISETSAPSVVSPLANNRVSLLLGRSLTGIPNFNCCFASVVPVAEFDFGLMYQRDFGPVSIGFVFTGRQSTYATFGVNF
jgi:hypothetical protein